MLTQIRQPFLDEAIETAGPEALRQHQLNRLRGGLRRVMASNRFYGPRLRALGLEAPEDIRGIEDLRRLPLTTKRDLSEDQERQPPYGTNLTEPLEAYVRMFQTSGTTGKPLRWLDTAESLAWLGRAWQVGLVAAGVKPADRIFYSFSFGPFLAFWGAWEGAHAFGCLSIPGGGLGTDQRIIAMLDNQVTVLMCTPTYALRTAEVALEQGVDLRSSPIRITVHGGEPGASIPSTKSRIEEAFGALCMDTCGMTETGHLGWECWVRPGGVHLNEGEFIFEVIDPVTGQPVPMGERGELVITNLGRWGMPVIRYRSGDLVELDNTRCECGRTYVRARGGILGRSDDVLIVRGVNVFPSTLENVIRRHPQVVEYQTEAYRERGMLQLLVQVEIHPSVGSDEARSRLCRAVADDIRRTIGLRLRCEAAPAGSLPRFEMKAKRLQVREQGR